MAFTFYIRWIRLHTVRASIPVWCRAIWHFTIYCTQRAQITRFHLVIPACKTRPVKQT